MSRRAIGAVALICSPAAWAGDLNPPAGPVAPTQKKLVELEPRTLVNATNTPGDADSVYRISQGGSYYLDRNLVGASGKACIEIASAAVTLDLNGYSLTGAPGALSAVRVTAAFPINIVIRNGSIDSWPVLGVDAQSANGITLKDLRATFIGGVAFHSGTNALVTDCVASFSGSGFIVGKRSIIDRCRADQSNIGYGMRINESCVVTDSVASGCATNGFQVDHNVTFTNCAAEANGITGFSTGQGCTLSQCASFNNMGFGFALGSASAITGCTARGNGLRGISVTSGGTVSFCAVFENGTDGISLSQGCSAWSNQSRGNGVAAEGHGIRITGADCRVESNNCVENDVGISSSTSGSFIARNTCSGNSTNWSIASFNICFVVVGNTVGAVNGDSGGVPPGSTDPNANFTY